MSVKKYIVNKKWWSILFYCMRTVILSMLWFVHGDKNGCLYLYIYIYIYSISPFLLLVGGQILIWNVMYFWECLYIFLIGLHMCKRCSIMNSVCPVSSCRRITFVLTIKLWMNSVYSYRIDETPLKNWNNVLELRVSTTQQLLSRTKCKWNELGWKWRNVHFAYQPLFQC